MNRTTLFGIALFFAVLGIAAVGGDNEANAGICGSHRGLLRHHRASACATATPQCAAPVACVADSGCCDSGNRCGLLARIRARHAARRAARNCCAAPACEPACAAPVDTCGGCGGCGDCGAVEPSCGAPMVVEPSCGAPAFMDGVIIEGPVEAVPVEAPADTEAAPEVPPAPAEEAAEGSA